MATHPDQAFTTYRHPSIFEAVAPEAPADPVAPTQEWLTEQAVVAATGFTPDQFRTGDRWISRVMVATSLMLLLFLCLRIVAAAFGGRL